MTHFRRDVIQEFVLGPLVLDIATRRSSSGSIPHRIMQRARDKTFVGFGFGPIQAGLFLLEAQRSGAFRRLVVAEVLAPVVSALRAAGGRFHVNVARLDGVEQVEVGPIEIENTGVAEDRERLIGAIATANELATAVPSIKFYGGPGEGSIHRLLARGLERRGGAPCVVYAAENHNHAAEALEALVLEEVTPAQRDRVRAGTRFLNTVIGKMSAVIPDPPPRHRRITPGEPRAFLVESFNRILISRITLPPELGFRRGIEAFEEKPDLLPFEEAKLHGHNAAHALAAYLAAAQGLQRIEELRELPGAMEYVRAALLEEAGAALCRKWAGVDGLFTPGGFERHVNDLLPRMFNPYLEDPVERVARDPERKLGWDDRLVGTMRLALRQKIVPRRFALGAALALRYLTPRFEDLAPRASGVLSALWQPAAPDPLEAREVLELITAGLATARAWIERKISPFE